MRERTDARVTEPRDRRGRRISDRAYVWVDGARLDSWPDGAKLQRVGPIVGLHYRAEPEVEHLVIVNERGKLELLTARKLGVPAARVKCWSPIPNHTRWVWLVQAPLAP